MKKWFVILGVIVVIAGAFVAQIFLQRSGPSTVPVTVTSTPMPTAFTITSSAFSPNGLIPVKYSCDGENISPPLSIFMVPDNTVSLALVVDDIDSPRGTFVHWLLWNIDPKISEIVEGTTPPGAGVGANDFQETQYGGPCPPFGEHRYVFTLYALDDYMVFTEKTRKNQLEDAMNGHIIAKTTLTARFAR